MSVSVLIISHHDIGDALIRAAKTTFGKENLPLPTYVFNVLPDTDPEQMIPKIKKVIRKLNQNEGILILTDLFGATPSNIAQELQDDNIRIVTGLNLPMLLRVMNYANLNLTQLAENAFKGGQAGIIECDRID